MIEGLVYKVAAYQEHAKLLFMYTPLGKITLIAQGSQKIQSKDRVLAQYLMHISFEETYGKTMYKLKGGKIINDYQQIKASYDTLKQAALILEVIDKCVVENENHTYIMKEALLALHTDVSQSSLSFAVKILHDLGYFLDLKPTGAKIVGFSIKYSRLIYEAEQIKPDLDTKETLILLKLTTQNYEDLIPMDEQTLSKIKAFVHAYYTYHLQVRLKTLE